MARDLGVGVPLLGQVVAAMLLVSAAIGLVAGPLADRYGHRRVILLGLVWAAICLLLFGLARNFAVLLAGALAGGLANAAVLGPSLAVAGTYFAGDRRRAGRWGGRPPAWRARRSWACRLLTAVATVTGWRLAFVAAGARRDRSGLVGSRLAARDARRPGGRLRAETLLAAYRPLLRHGPTLRLYGVAVLRAICWFGMLTYFGAFLAERARRWDTGQVGLAYMLGGGGYFLGSAALGRTARPRAAPARCWWRATSPWRC